MLALRKPNVFPKLPSFEQRGCNFNGYNRTHTYVRMLTFCITALIYYIIINLAYAFMKNTYITTVYTKVLSTILIKYAKGTLKCVFMYQLLKFGSCNKYSLTYL